MQGTFENNRGSQPVQGKRGLESKVWMADERWKMDESALGHALPSHFRPYVPTFCLPYDDIHDNGFDNDRGSQPKMIEAHSHNNDKGSQP